MVINDVDIIEASNKPTYVTWGWFEDHILNSFFLLIALMTIMVNLKQVLGVFVMELEDYQKKPEHNLMLVMNFHHS